MSERQYGIHPGYRGEPPSMPQVPRPLQSAYNHPVRYGPTPGSAPSSSPRQSMQMNAARQSAQRNAARQSVQTDAARQSVQTNPAMQELPPPSTQRKARRGSSRHDHTRSTDRLDLRSQPPDSGLQALRDIDNLYGGRMMSSSPDLEDDDEYKISPKVYSTAPLSKRPRRNHQYTDSQSSIAPLATRGASPARQVSPVKANKARTSEASATRHEVPMSRGYVFQGDGYDDYVNPNDITDDENDRLEEHPKQRHGRLLSVPAAGVANETPKAISSRGPSGDYGASPRVSRDGTDPEKSEHFQDQRNGSRRRKWIIGGIVAVVLLAVIIGGAVGGVLANKKSSSSSSSDDSSPSSSDNESGLYDINSHQVQALLNNDALHKVFPGMDYTPLNAQYPECLSIPPDQNNITLDIAMLAQLTPAVRLYGTDCNQTEMVLTAIDSLGYNDTVKVWLGVWLGNNATTNARQMRQMYDILDNYPSSHFAGVIVGNEILFRKDMTEAQLGDQMQSVRKNLTARNIDIPVATSDLGDDWTPALEADTDIVMANVHPFFAGVTPDLAPGWTWEFWQNNDVVLTGSSSSSSGYPKNIIAETGWPSTGGNDCGTNDACSSATAGAVASIENMNIFMDGFVCQSLANGTTYFWFEAFDEPWKVVFDTATDKWESKWGLMDSNRNIKEGLKIPDCGGKTVDKPY